MKRTCLFILLFLLSDIAAADIILLKNGRQIKNQGLWIEDNHVKWVSGGEISSLSVDQVTMIKREPIDTASSASQDDRVAIQSNPSGKKILSNHTLDQFSMPADNQPSLAPDQTGSKTAVPPGKTDASAAELNRQAKTLIKDGHYTDTDKALSILDQALAADPDCPETYQNRGRVYMDREDYDKAAKAFGKGISLESQNPGAGHPELAASYYSLGLALYKLADFDGAVENFQQALSVRQAHPEVKYPSAETLHNRLGLVYSAKGDYNRSIDHYSRALEIIRNTRGPADLETAVIYNNLGAVCYKNRDFDGAIRYFQQALDIRRAGLGEDHPSVKQVQKYLDMARQHQ